MTDDPYHFWRESLAGNKPPIINEDPQAGFYRMKRGGKFVAVAVFPGQEFGLRFKIGHSMALSEVGVENWPWYAANPITEEVYRAVTERGENWPDMDATVAEQLNAPKADQVEGFKAQIETAAAGITAYVTIESDDKAAQAQSLRALLLKLSRDADAQRKAEKEPHLEKGRQVDRKWKPLVDNADGAARTLRDAIAAWETVKLQAHQQAVKINPVAPQSNTPPPAAQVRGAYGKAAAVGARQEITITDIDTVFAHFKGHPEVHALLTRLAQAATNIGIEVAGISKELKATVR